MECMTYREASVWLYRMNQEIENRNKRLYEPSLTDYYIMQNTKEIRFFRYMLARDAEINFTLKDFRLGPTEEKEEASYSRAQQVNQASQAAWAQRVKSFGGQLPDFKQWQSNNSSSAS